VKSVVMWLGKAKALFEPQEDGTWVASIPSLQGCHTQGRTLNEARERLAEAMAVSVGHGDLWPHEPEEP
jgi:predicted RNase H-like HicB family nuclease